MNIRYSQAGAWFGAVRRLTLVGGFIAAATMVAGCSAVVKTSRETPLIVDPTSHDEVTINIVGSKVSTQSADWESFKGVWRDECKAEATPSQVSLAFQEGPPKATGENGTLVVIDISDYRYINEGTRYGFGVMTGNAYIDSTVTFRSLATGKEWGSRSYTSSSSAWQGQFSAMTDKQVRAICHHIVDDVAAPSARVARQQ